MIIIFSIIMGLLGALGVLGILYLFYDIITDKPNIKPQKPETETKLRFNKPKI